MLETAVPDEPDNAIHLTTCAEWRAWLEQHHIRPEGVWLISFKKGTGKPRVAYEEAVEEALCFGWIDSTQRTLDDERAMLWFAPRTMYRLVEAEQAAYRAADSRRADGSGRIGEGRGCQTGWLLAGARCGRGARHSA